MCRKTVIYCCYVSCWCRQLIAAGSFALTPYLDLLGVGKLRPLHERRKCGKSFKVVQGYSKLHRWVGRKFLAYYLSTVNLNLWIGYAVLEIFMRSNFKENNKSICITSEAMQCRQAPWAIFSYFFYTKLGIGRVSQVHSLTPNFTVVALNNYVGLQA